MDKEYINLEKLRKGKLVRIGNSVFGLCSDCLALIKVNKFIFGSLHLCLTEEELKRKRGDYV